MLKLWEKFRAVPKEAQRPIKGGRLAGRTDINPVWRIKALTEAFGPCGIGWRYEVTNKELLTGAKGEIAAIVDINLYYKYDGEWSYPIPGTGGSMFTETQKGSLYTSDECYKMALTDAISVSCKALGIAADIYWEADSTKYSDRPDHQADQRQTQQRQQTAAPEDQLLTKDMQQMMMDLVTDAEGRLLTHEQEFLASIYRKYGYNKAREIKVKHFKAIVDEFRNATKLPFDV